MRRLMRQVIEGARDRMHDWDRVVAQGRQLTEEEQVQRYIRFHRGKPRELISFARKMNPDGDALREAARYEEAMERRLRRNQ